uniref:Uncharacterized protein n=1 Tax=Arundo donax TaxID=35708 RepID=A0A0A9CUI2_ARUDO
MINMQNYLWSKTDYGGTKVQNYLGLKQIVEEQEEEHRALTSRSLLRITNGLLFTFTNSTSS